MRGWADWVGSLVLWPLKCIKFYNRNWTPENAWQRPALVPLGSICPHAPLSSIWRRFSSWKLLGGLAVWTWVHWGTLDRDFCHSHDICVFDQFPFSAGRVVFDITSSSSRIRARMKKEFVRRCITGAWVNCQKINETGCLVKLSYRKCHQTESTCFLWPGYLATSNRKNSNVNKNQKLRESLTWYFSYLVKKRWILCYRLKTNTRVRVSLWLSSIVAEPEADRRVDLNSKWDRRESM